MLRSITLLILLALAGCSSAPFRTGSPESPPPTTTTAGSGSGPVLTPPAEVEQPPPESVIEPPTVQIPRERPRSPPATLSPASRALVTQAQAQRQRGDLPGATVSLDRALRIEPNSPLLWIEMGRLRMDQGNFQQAENMGRKALSMSVGDDRTQALAWQLVGDSLKARGKNPQAQDAYDRSEALSTR